MTSRKRRREQVITETPRKRDDRGRRGGGPGAKSSSFDALNRTSPGARPASFIVGNSAATEPGGAYTVNAAVRGARCSPWVYRRFTEGLRHQTKLEVGNASPARNVGLAAPGKRALSRR